MASGEPTPCDVVIVGAGIAGSFLARQLKSTCPELHVVVLEAAPALVDHKVGESTVEVSAHYMIRRLGLSAYLYSRQLPKNGLRFFFDSAAKDTALPEMSEMGSDHFPFHPSFQLERASFERDLVEMNRALGVSVELHAKVVDVAVDAQTFHTVTWERGGERREVRARWVCDASGRRQVLSRKLGRSITRDSRLNTAAAWGRYRGVAGLDAAGDDAWRARVRHTSRHLSTNHFMYDGYWIWFIPLAGDLMSVGVVFDQDRVSDGPRTQGDMMAFLERHRAPRELLAGAVMEDFQSYAHLPFHSETYFSMDRWALTGEAGAFTDPFYSPGSDFIATANELITALIVTERNGDRGAWERLSELSNAFYRQRYETNLALYTSQYATFGSFEVFRWKYRLDFHNYYNLVYWPFLAGKVTDPAWLDEQVRSGELQLRAIRAFGSHFTKLAEVLRQRGEYHATNRGRFVNGLEGVAHLQEHLGPRLNASFQTSELQRTYAAVFTAILERTLCVSGLAGRAWVERELTLPVILALKDPDEVCLARLLQRVSGKLTRDIRAHFPEIDTLEIKLVAEEKAGGHERQVRLVATAESKDVSEKAALRAHALWEEPSA